MPEKKSISTHSPHPPRRPDPDGRAFRAAAARLALSFCPPIYPCGACGWPVVRGYRCTTCGSIAPGWRTVAGPDTLED